MNDMQEIKLEDVVTVSNFRRQFDDGKLAELTASVKEFGVLEPILVRPVGEKGALTGKKLYTLIAGERRLRAAKEAGLKTVPVRVLDVDANGAAEIQLLENLHREDLSPMDEARALHTLMTQGKHTAETLAERVDKSVAYVYRAVRLLELPEAGIQAIETGKLTPAHGHQILRAPAEKRDELVEFSLRQSEHRAFPAWELRNHIEYQFAADLADALFPKGKAYAGEPACSSCAFNSGNQGQLFDGAEKGKCSHPDCFKRKTACFMDDYSKAAAADHPGLQYLGIQTPDYAGGLEGMKRALVLSGDLPRQTAKMVKANPEKFGWAVIAPRGRGEKPTSTIVCLDRRILQQGDARVAGGGTGNGATYAQQRFVDDAVQTALRTAVADTIEGSRFDFTKAQWSVIQKTLAPWPEPAATSNRELAAQLLVRLATSDDDLETLGIDAVKLTAAAAREAEKRWKAEQVAKGK